MNVADYDIYSAHVSHCCPVHGCKYTLDDECPIVNKVVTTLYRKNNGCEQCEDDSEERRRLSDTPISNEQIEQLAQELLYIERSEYIDVAASKKYGWLRRRAANVILQQSEWELPRVGETDPEKFQILLDRATRLIRAVEKIRR